MKNRSAPNHGFALVIALSLMAFILLLILSITTLVRVETQSANIQLAQLEARMNAQLGAMIALGDLQRYTGPDQRVTARADILIAPGQSGPTGQERWTGVWSSKADVGDSLDAVDGLQAHQPKWLVSGLNPDAYSAVAGDTADLATVGKSVIDKSASTTDDTVKAPKVEILGDDNVPEGHYAYWVSDEGVKARVNMADPYLDSGAFNPNDQNSDEAYYRTAMAQVADPTAVTNSDGSQPLAGGDSRWKNETQDPDKISSLKNIPMFTGDNLPSDEFFHDFTVHSSGVLANTKDGGLKRDLSTALLNLPPDMREGGINSPMFPPANGPSSPGQMNPGGPKWEQLSDYYKLAYDNSKLPSDDDRPLRMPTNEQVGFTPVITRSNFFVYGFAERNPAREASGNWCDNTDPGTLPGSDWEDWENPNSDWYCARGYRYSLGMFPLITLWNPYDRDMTFDDLGLEFELPRIDIVSSGGSTNTVAATGIETSKWNGKSNGGANEVSRFTVKFVIRGITLGAGEAVNFSPPCNSFYDKDDPSENVLVARASAPFVNGFFTPAVTSTSGEVFWQNSAERATNYATGSRSRLSINFTPTSGNQSLYKQQVMLYSSTDVKNSQFLSENRFKAIDITGFGVFTSPWHQQSVILTNRLSGIGGNGYNLHINAGASSPYYKDPLDGVAGTSYFSDFIAPSGDSKKTDHKYPFTDLIEGDTLADDGLGYRNPWGNVGAMRFPKVPARTWAPKGSESEIHLFLNINPTAPVIHKEPNITYDQDTERMSQSNVYTQGHVKPWDRGKSDIYYKEHISAGTGSPQARVGLSNTQIDGSERMVLLEVPDNIPLSIGQLAHANLMNFDVLGDGSTSPAIGNKVKGNKDKWNSHTLQTYATPTYAIGNSLASPFLSLDSTEEWFSSVRTPWTSVPAAHYDYSYKLNDALWDEYFFSGITGSARGVFPLPNSRFSLRSSKSSSTTTDLTGENAVLAGLLSFGASNIDPTSSLAIEVALITTENRAATNLLLDGAFNINSTSVAAWESVLGAMRDVETKGHISGPTLRHNFARFNEPLMGMPATGESVPQLSNKDQLAAGYRNLTDAQIASLASEIVDEIRLRSATPDQNGDKYPFLSLSEFINRSPLSNTKAFAWRGALQAAIDKANLNGLESVNTGLWAESAEYPLYYDSGDTPIIDRPKADGMPGAFMQSDLLAKIGAFIQARSDTFTIRSYGSSREQFGSEDGSRAYYEMVVQRTPAYVDLGNDAYEDAALIVNQEFGRKYEIKSQRWVAADEI